MTPSPAGEPTDVRRGVSVCVFRGDRVLMVERGRPPAAGLWAPIGGGIEPGETAAEAAIRETAEETGVTIRLIGVAGRRTFLTEPAGGRGSLRIDLTVFAARHLDGEPVAGDDAAAARFVGPDALVRLALVPGVLPFIAVARRVASGRGPGGSAMDRRGGSGRAGIAPEGDGAWRSER